MGYLRVACLLKTILLSASVCLHLSVCFVHVSVCELVQLEMHSPGNTNKITDVRPLTCSFLYLTFTATNMPVVIISGTWEW